MVVKREERMCVWTWMETLSPEWWKLGTDVQNKGLTMKNKSGSAVEQTG